MSFCPNCGTKIDAGSRFCGECGIKIEDVQIPVNMDDVSVSQQMPWEQEVTPAEPTKMPWEQSASAGFQEVQQEQAVNMGTAQQMGKQQTGGQTERTTSVRPSEARRVRQQQGSSGSSITLKKPNINVKNYANKAKKLSKMQITVIVEAILLIVVIGVFVAIGSSQSSAESVAKKYFQAIVESDWSTVYDLTDYPDGKYLQKEQFLAAMGNQELMNISNYEITEVPSYGYDSESFWGSSDEQSSSSSGIQKTLYVEYTVQGQGTGSFVINLVKQAEKNMLFFDSWKVTSDLFPATEYYIAVPIGADVTINGVALTDEEKHNNEEYGMDEYYVPLFAGTYSMQVGLPWFQIYETEFTVGADGGTSVYDMQLTEDGELAMMAMMQEALESCYKSALEKEDFSAVSDLFMEGYEESAKESYEYLVEDLHDSDYYTLKEVTFSDFACECSVTDGGVYVEMNFDYDMKYQYTQTSYRGVSSSVDRTDDGTAYMSGTFGYDGETYKLTSVYIHSVI